MQVTLLYSISPQLECLWSKDLIFYLAVLAIIELGQETELGQNNALVKCDHNGVESISFYTAKTFSPFPYYYRVDFVAQNSILLVGLINNIILIY